jgi:hypothetical protein
VFLYKGQWYVAYHDLFPTDKYRKTCMEIIHYRDSGDIARVQPTREGVGWYDAAEIIEAEDYFEKSADIEYRENVGTGFHMHALNGSWIRFNNVKPDFGTHEHFTARVATGSRGGKIEIFFDALTGEKAGELTVTNTGGWDAWQEMETPVTPFSGIRDIVLRFTGGEEELFDIDWFRIY